MARRASCDVERPKESHMRTFAWIYRFTVLAALVMAAGAGWKWGI
jgi:hypothetical protein